MDEATGEISGTLAVGSGGSARWPYRVTVAASDGTLSSRRTFSWTVNPWVTMTTVDDQADQEGDTVALTVVANDSGNLTLTYSADDLPDGLSIDSGTGVISGTITSGAAADGPYLVTVTASNGVYSSAEVFLWTVTHGANTAPSLTNPGNQANGAWDVVDLALTASDADDDTLVFTATGLPEGVGIDPSTGLLSGYLSPGAVKVGSPDNVEIRVDDANGGSATQTFQWVVTDWAVSGPPLSGEGLSISAAEGTPAFGAAVATFTDTNMSREPGDYVAIVDWGDGTAEEGTVSGEAGSFTVTGDHRYEEPGEFTVTTTITDPAGITIAVSTDAEVDPAELVVRGGLVVYAIEGVEAEWTLAAIADENRGEEAGSLSGTIAWGDGSNGSAEPIEGSNGAFTLNGKHTYAEVGTYSIEVTVGDDDDTSDSTTGAVVVGDIYAGIRASLVVASFVGDLDAEVSDFTAVIDWGDGTSSAGVVSESGGEFTIAGNHKYTEAGTYTVEVTVTDLDDHSIIATNSVTVVPAPLVGYAVDVVATEDLTLSNTLSGVFVDPNVSNTVGQYTSTVDPGDGTDLEDATVTGGGGLYHVLFSHTVSSSGVFHPQTNIIQNETDPTVVLLSTAFAGFHVVPIENHEGDPPPQSGILAVHPLASDFKAGKAGRIMMNSGFSDMHTDYQVHAGIVWITAELPPEAIGKMVYFEVIDPDDPARPSNNKGFKSDWEDWYAFTPFSSTGKGVDGDYPNSYNIELETSPKKVGQNSDSFPEDNRDFGSGGMASLTMSRRNLQEQSGTKERYEAMQLGVLHERSVKAYEGMVGDKRRAIAEVAMNMTSRFAGDNYIVRATLVNPEGKPFNTQSASRVAGYNAGIPAAKIQQTTLLTAWDRLYYEEDWMYKGGSYLAQQAAKGTTTLQVLSRSPN